MLSILLRKPSHLILVLFLVFSCDLTIEEEVSVKKSVPETAIFGLTSNDLSAIQAFINHPGAQSILQELNTNNDAVIYDSIISPVLSGKEFSLSWHSSSRSDLESLLIVDFKDISLNSSLLQFSGEPSVSNYNGYEIKSIQGAERAIHFCVSDNQLAVSHSKILVEDYVRAQEDESASLQGLDSDLQETILFINNDRLDEVGLESFGKVGGVSILTYELGENSILYNGSIKVSQKSGDNAQLFGAAYVPAEFESIEWVSQPQSSTELGQSFLKVGLSVFAESEELLIAKPADSEKMLMELKQLAGTLLSSNDSLPYLESYANEEIRFISSDFFKGLFNNEDLDLEDGAFFCIANTHLLVSTSAEAIRQSLSSHADELTVGQSVEDRAFYNGLIQDTYYTLVQSFEGSSSSHNNSRLARLIYQTNTFSNGILVNGRVDLTAERSEEVNEAGANSGQLIANAFLDTAAVVKAKVLTNHVDQTKELVVQDAKNQLYQISSEGELNWKIQMESKLKAPVLQVDYYNNRKLQYLLLTDSLIHIIDRNGEEIEGFPVAHGITENINGIELVDYDNTKRYRYLIEAGRGFLYLFNKEAELLEGWNPKELDAVLPALPRHERIAGKDFFWVAERSNKLILLNRRGENYSGFPFQKSFRFSGDVYLLRSPTFQGSQFVALSEKGKLIQVDLLGQLKREEQLFLTNSNTRYQLIKDVLGNGYLISRLEDRVSIFLNEDQEELFQLSERLGANEKLSYYRFRGGAEIVLIQNSETGKVRLFNLDGVQIGETVQSDYAPSLIYYRNKGVYHLFANFDNEVNIYEFTSPTK